MLLRKKLSTPVFILFVVCTVLLIKDCVSFAAEPIYEKQVDQSSKFVAIDFNDVDINVFIKFISKFNFLTKL